MGKYFKYAVGEIILVVIGILIALQINNYNAGLKDKRAEKAYLENIKRDLVRQSATIASQMATEKSYYEAAQTSIQAFDNSGKFKADSSFFKTLTLLGSRKTFVITDPTYTDLISSGNIALLRNKTLKDHILKFYQDLKRVEKVIQNNNNFLIDNQYNSALLKLGYYYFNDYSTLGMNPSELEIATMPTQYDSVFQNYSQNMLQKEENRLALMNAINSRKVVAMVHYSLLTKAKLNTETLLKEFN